MLQRLTAISLFLVIIVSCQQPQQETSIVPQLSLSIDEVKVPLSDDMPNDWNGVTSSFENGERLLHIYDVYRKNIIQYSLDQEKLLKRVLPFSDTLDPRNVSVSLYRLNNGYYLSSASLGFMKIDEEGKLIRVWDHFIPRRARIKNWDYDTKYRLRSSKNLILSMLDEWTIPIHIELANVFMDGVYLNDFYTHDIFASLDMNSGELVQFPIRFPEQFNTNDLSYPRHLIPAFVGMGASKMAYFFGHNDNINLLDTQSGKVEELKVSNPNFPVNINPIDRASFLNSTITEEVYANSNYYIGLYFDPYRKGLLRTGINIQDGISSRIYELLDENLKIVAQFEQPTIDYSRPLFFPNEIWFPYDQGFAENEMKLLRVRIEE